MEGGLDRAALAAGAGIQQLMNKLTDHLWLYHNAEGYAKSAFSKEKSDVLDWFQCLSPAQRQEVLTIRDREWIAVLLQMQRKVVAMGPVSFFLMLDMADPGARRSMLRSLQPELLSRRQTGLLARLTEQSKAGSDLVSSLLLLSSECRKPAPIKGKSKGLKKKAETRMEFELDTVTVSRSFLEDPQTLVRTLDCLTLGQFLQIPSHQQSPSSWDETPWLHSMGYYALPYFVANRLEIALWSAWLKSAASKALRRSILKGRSTKAASLQDSNSLETQRAVQSWWQKLGAETKSSVLQAGVARLAKQLAIEKVADAREGRDLRVRGVDPASLQELGKRGGLVALQTERRGLAGSQASLKRVPWLAGLLALQELAEKGVLPSKGRSAAGKKSGEAARNPRKSRQDKRQMESDMEWLMMTYGSREEGMHKDDALFCTSLDLACTLRGSLICRLRQVVQQLMQEQIAQDLLAGTENVGDSVSKRGNQTSAGSNKSASAKKKRQSNRALSGGPGLGAVSAGERPNTVSSLDGAEIAPGGNQPAREGTAPKAVRASLPSQLSSSSDLPTETPPITIKEADTGASLVQLRGRNAETQVETDEGERCSSSGETWEEVGAAKRRKERRRKTEDKDVKREPRKRALAAQWSSQDGQSHQNGAVESDGEHRKRRRRRKNKERKKEEVTAVEESSIRVSETSSASVNVPQRHSGWNLAAPVFEPRSVPKPTSMLEESRHLSRAGLTQNGAGIRPTPGGPKLEAAGRPAATVPKPTALSSSLVKSDAMVQKRLPGAKGPQSSKRSLSAGNASSNQPELQTSTADSQAAPLVVPITPLKQTQTAPTESSAAKNQSLTKEKPSQGLQSAADQTNEQQRFHEWPQFRGGFTVTPGVMRPAAEQPLLATNSASAGPSATIHVTGFDISREHAQSTLQSYTEGFTSSKNSSLSQPIAFNLRNGGALLPPPAAKLPLDTPFQPREGMSVDPAYTFASPFLRPVAMHRSRSSHQLPDNGYPIEQPEQLSWAGQSFWGPADPGGLDPPVAFQNFSPESHWPPTLPRITVPTVDYFTDEDWLLGGGEEPEGSMRSGHAYDGESEADVSGRYVMSEGEVEAPGSEHPFRSEAAQDDSRIDYSRIFDGGVLYWTADNYSTVGPSRPNSLSSNDSMWMRREADISYIVDDITGAQYPAGESPTSLPYVAADVSTPRASPAPSERAPSPLLGVERSSSFDPPDAIRRLRPVRAVHLQGSRPSPVLVRANLSHTPPRYQGLSPDLRYARGLSPDTFGRHLPKYHLTRQGSVGAANDVQGADVRWKRPSSPVLRSNHAPPAVPIARARARPTNVRSGSSSPRHWAPALDGREGEKAPADSLKGAGPDSGPAGGTFTPAGGAGLSRNPSIKKGLPPLAPVTHSPDQDHPDVLIPIHHWVTVPPFEQQVESVPTNLIEPTLNAQNNQPGFEELTQLQPVVLLSPLTLPPPQHVPSEWVRFHDLLHREVEQFCSANKEEIAKKRPFQLAAITKVSKALQVLWPRSRITVFGSFLTGLALPTSDIDLLVCLPPVRNLEPIKEAGILEGRNGIKETMLQHAARYLADQDWVKTDSMKTIENTAVPIIQLVAQMPLQPLQASGSPGEKVPEERLPLLGELNLPPEESRGIESALSEKKGLVLSGLEQSKKESLGSESSETVRASVWSAAKRDSKEIEGPAERGTGRSKSEPIGAFASSIKIGRREEREVGPAAITGRSNLLRIEPLTGSENRIGRLSMQDCQFENRSSVSSEPPVTEPADLRLEQPALSAREIVSPSTQAQQDHPGRNGHNFVAEDSLQQGVRDVAGRTKDVELTTNKTELSELEVRVPTTPQEPNSQELTGAKGSGSVALDTGRTLPCIRPRADLDQLNKEHVEGAHSPVDLERRLVKLDISFEGVQHTGSRTTDLVRELVAQFPPLPPLVLVLKQFLTDRSLDHPYTGGLSSYCLVLLLTRFLQHEQHVSGVRAQQAGQNLGLLLIDFLHFFGCVFDPRRMGVSIRGGGLYIDRDKGHSIDPLYIEDPLNPLNNVGRNCFRILQCTKAFAEGYALLCKQLHVLDADSNLFAKILTKCG